MASLKAVMSLMTGGYSSSINRVMRDTDKATDKVLKASGATDKFNKKLESTGASANKASGGLGKFISLAAAIAGAVKGMSIADEYTNTAARLDLINDGLQTQAELQDKIFAAANRSRGEYNGMADAVAKMGLLAKDAFTSNDELIAFTELIQKSFKVSGADTSEQQGAMRQISQAMASGRLQGDELVSIMENAPMVYDAIAKYMGKSKGELKKLSSEGVITSDIIKAAVFAAGDDINAKFDTMPRNFGDVWNRIKNSALKAFAPIIEKVNKLINTDEFQKAVDKLIIGFGLAANAASWLIDVIVNGWDIIGPILAIIAGVALVAIIAQIWGVVAALTAQAVATLAALWPLLLIIGIIAIVIAAARYFGATWEDIFGFVGAIIGHFAVGFNNTFALIWNVVASFVNFFGNVFNDPIAAVQTLFFDLATNVLGCIEKMAGGIEELLNKIPGIEIDVTSGIASLRNKLASKSAEIKTEAGLKTYVESKEFMDPSEGWTIGAQMGKDLYTGMTDKLDSLSEMLTGTGAGFDINQFGTGNNPLHVTSDDKLKVDMSDEDLKYLRDIAEREYVNKFSTATLAPNIQISFGDVHEEADADKVADRIKQILQEEIAMVAEGVYA